MKNLNSILIDRQRKGGTIDTIERVKKKKEIKKEIQFKYWIIYVPFVKCLSIKYE